MTNEIALKIDYYVLGKSETENYGEDELNIFRDQLQKDYIVTFNKKVAERGAGNFIIELLFNLSLKDYLMIIIGGAAWDLVKIGTRNFLVRPFIEQYKNFRLTVFSQEIRDIVFTFSDTKLHIYSVIDNEVEVSFSIISQVFQELAKYYNQLDNVPTNKLTDIHIPIFHDITSKSQEIYRQKLSVDEPLSVEIDENIFDRSAYFKLWGLSYFNYERKIFDLQKQALMKKTWLLEDEYEWHINPD